MSGILCAVAGMGGGGSETQTVTVGNFTFKGIESWGFNRSVFGSINDGTFGFISNAQINVLAWSNSDNGVGFTLAGNRSNSGWTKMTISGVDYTRASATYSYDGGADTTQWRWTSPGTNPFGTTIGATVAAVFTA
jgi:hypothetical protein